MFGFVYLARYTHGAASQSRGNDQTVREQQASSEAYQVTAAVEDNEDDQAAPLMSQTQDSQPTQPGVSQRATHTQTLSVLDRNSDTTWTREQDQQGELDNASRRGVKVPWNEPHATTTAGDTTPHTEPAPTHNDAKEPRAPHRTARKRHVLRDPAGTKHTPTDAKARRQRPQRPTPPWRQPRAPPTSPGLEDDRQQEPTGDCKGDTTVRRTCPCGDNLNHRTIGRAQSCTHCGGSFRQRGGYRCERDPSHAYCRDCATCQRPRTAQQDQDTTTGPTNERTTGAARERPRRQRPHRATSTQPRPLQTAARTRSRHHPPRSTATRPDTQQQTSGEPARPSNATQPATLAADDGRPRATLDDNMGIARDDMPEFDVCPNCAWAWPRHPLPANDVPVVCNHYHNTTAARHLRSTPATSSEMPISYSPMAAESNPQLRSGHAHMAPQRGRRATPQRRPRCQESTTAPILLPLPHAARNRPDDPHELPRRTNGINTVKPQPTSG